MVAERIGRTAPSIYLHFPDKSSLMWAVCQRDFGESEGHMIAATEGIEDPIERLSAMALAYLEWAAANPEQYRILFMTDRSARGGVASLADLATTPGFALLIDNLRDGTDAGALIDVDPLVLALNVWAAVHGAASLLVAQPAMGWPEPAVWWASLQAQVLDGIRVRPSS